MHSHMRVGVGKWVKSTYYKGKKVNWLDWLAAGGEQGCSV